MPKDKKSDSEKLKKDGKEKKGKKKDKSAKDVAPKTEPKPVKAEPKPVTKIAKEKPAPKAAVKITDDDISLRAYFIAERRQAMGWPGDSSSDWVEAERQLKAESARKK